MRWSATVVLPEPAVPRITTKPADGPRDQRELLGVDQAGDVGQALVGAARARRSGSVPSRRAAAVARRVHAERGALAAREPRRLARDAHASCPLASATKIPSGASMRASVAAADRDRAARDDLAR